MVKVHDNATYALRELDGTLLRIPVAGKRIKAFKKRDGMYLLGDTTTEDLNLSPQEDDDGVIEEETEEEEDEEEEEGKEHERNASD